MSVHFAMDERYTGHGASSGLSRGLLVFNGEKNVTSEGMGIGAVAMRIGHTTYFSSSAGAWLLDTGVYRKKFVFNKRMEWSMFSIKSKALTKLIERVTELYMSNKSLQKTVMSPALGVFARRFFELSPGFVSAAPAGEAVFDYRLSGGTVRVRCEIRTEKGHDRRIYVMNEASADFFDAGLHDGRVVPPPSGWEKHFGRGAGISLFNTEERICFSLADIALDARSGCRLGVFRGREKTEHLSWAGFALEIEQGPEHNIPVELSYEARFYIGEIHE
jgi:hypothetical protein